MKYYYFNTWGSKELALNKAIDYRDTIINNLVQNIALKN